MTGRAPTPKRGQIKFKMNQNNNKNNRRNKYKSPQKAP